LNTKGYEMCQAQSPVFSVMIHFSAYPVPNLFSLATHGCPGHGDHQF
jgi:hypothetical protein